MKNVEAAPKNINLEKYENIKSLQFSFENIFFIKTFPGNRRFTKKTTFIQNMKYRK